MSDISLGRVGLWTFDLDTVPMSRARELAAEIEQLGFGTVWVPEAVGREPFASTALLLSATGTLRVATGIASLHARTAQTMNAGLATLTEAFPERFVLGIGVSHQPMVEGAHGGTYDKPYSTMVRYLDSMDKAMYFGAPPATPPRRMLAALGPKMLRLAAERTLGAHPYFVPVEHTASARGILGSGALLAPEVGVVFEADADKARAVARGHMAMYLRLPNYANNLMRLGWSEDDITGASDALVDAIVGWGTPERVAARVKEHLEAGADHVCVQVLGAPPGQPPLDQWRLLADLVRGW